MPAKISIAKNTKTLHLQHIDSVDKKEHCEYLCEECGGRLMPVQSKRRIRIWHFRHIVEPANIRACANRALHDFAVQVISQNTYILLPKFGRIVYEYIDNEVIVAGKYRSDATVKHNESIIHFEVFVKNDLEPDKIDAYCRENIYCIKIDLSDKSLLSADEKTIRQKILTDVDNKSIVSPKEKPQISIVMNNDTWLDRNFENIMLGGVLLGAALLVNRSVNKKKNLRRAREEKFERMLSKYKQISKKKGKY